MTAETRTTASITDSGDDPAARLTPRLRRAAAATLVLGTGLQAASWLVHSDPNLEARYSLIATHAGQPELSLVLNLLATPFWVASVAVFVLLGRLRSPRLAWAGGGLLVTGLIGLAYNLGTEILASALVQDKLLTPGEMANAVTGLDSPPATVMNLLFVVGVGLGIPLTGISLWRSHAVPRPAAALLVSFLVLDLAGQGAPTATLAVLAHVIAFIAAGWIAATLLRPRPPAR